MHTNHMDQSPTPTITTPGACETPGYRWRQWRRFDIDSGTIPKTNIPYGSNEGNRWHGKNLREGVFNVLHTVSIIKQPFAGS
jgi:hypothetical protein